MTKSADQLHDEVFGHGHVTEISGAMRPLREDLREIWAYRDLLFLLIQRDITVRYKQSIIGIAWAVVQPLMMLLVFSVIFGRFAKLPSDGIPYPLFTMAALLPWLYFSRALTGSSDSLVTAANLVKKVYFPRLILPLSKVISGLVDFLVSFALVILMLALYGVIPGPALLLLPIFVLMAMITALSVGLWLTALNVKYRDITLLVPFLGQIWMYASPVAYSTTLVPERWLWVYSLNPMVGIIEGFRWALLGTSPPNLDTISISFGLVLVLFIGGVNFFRRSERTLADII